VTVFIPTTGREKNFSDEELISIAPLLDKITKFDTLSLQDTSVGDRGMRALSHVQKLKTVNLIGTKVTLEGLLSLKNSPKLTLIIIDRWRLSITDVEKLQRSLGTQISLDIR